MRDMLGREELIPVEKALQILFQHAPFQLPNEMLTPLEDAYGLVVSRDIISPEDLPGFGRSTVDGFAVRAADTFGATEGLPAYLKLVAEIAMGERPQCALHKGQCAKIATGGMLPEKADAVVMFEYSQRVEHDSIEVVRPVSPGENVIQAGEDATKGETILKRGHRLRPQDVGALAGVGLSEIWTYKKPRVAIIATGDEVVPAREPLRPGQVRDINSYTLAGLVSDAGGIAEKKGIFRDEYEIIKDTVRLSLMHSEIILITGGSSVGTKDVTARVINDVGSPGVLFHGVALKPGKPTIGGVAGSVPIFGLPGHPAAVHICFEVFVRPVLELQSGAGFDRFGRHRRTLRARVTRNIASSPGREEHIGVMIEDRNGEPWAVPMLGKSGLITTLTKADGTAIIPLTKSGVREGDYLEVILF